MNQINRRTALAGAFMSAGASVAISQEKPQSEERTQDERYVMEAGMTPAEARAWRLIAEAAGAFFALPELHPMDKQEVASAIHIVQNKLLGRPTYRKYLELAKAGANEAVSEPK